MEIPPCPASTRGDCPRSDPVCVSEHDGSDTAYSFFCRTCKLGYVVTNPRGRAKAALDRELQRQQSLRPTLKERQYFDLGRNNR